MNAHPHAVFAGAALLFFVACNSGPADESDSVKRVAEALGINAAAAKSYVLAAAGDPPHELTFLDESLLRWSNPLAGEVFGDVFVWTYQGRPEVIGSFHQWYSPWTHGAHEFHSLSTGAINGQRGGESVWKSQQPGIELRRVPDQQAIPESRVARLSHMRMMSRNFTAQKTDREEVSRDLRLLPQPVYRYPVGDSNVLDGALFVFVQGTDPEVVVLIEARRHGDGWDWQYALARLNSTQFIAKYQGREVWRVETWPWNKVKSGVEPYTNFGPFNRPEANKRSPSGVDGEPPSIDSPPGINQ